MLQKKRRKNEIREERERKFGLFSYSATQRLCGAFFIFFLSTLGLALTDAEKDALWFFFFLLTCTPIPENRRLFSLYLFFYFSSTRKCGMTFFSNQLECWRYFQWKTDIEIVDSNEEYHCLHFIYSFETTY